ncbi:hypothetical protein BCF46_0707 [Litoreibacter meonggei]|uniref:Uncharacterized protein n=1 Tax=Litoreibacter meonggei TaxID=1049199 RepID=A0A497X5E7_9RHOB|nr:hypothetical protein [Litoreibacter meonggei]RLJ60506.1 hypothetical protein BCF46_0707 [Litoreibacter meonggei]
MVTLIIAAIILLPFYAGLSAALISTVRSRFIYGIAIMMVSGAIATPLWLFAQSVTSSGGFILVFPLLFLALVFLIGLGQFVGNLAKLLPADSLGHRIFVAAAFVLPAALISWGIYVSNTA